VDTVKRSAVTVAGGALIIGGVALMVLPGPGILLVVAGLAVLATEYVWARRVLGRAKKEAEHAQEQAVSSTPRTAATLLFALGGCALGVLMLVVDDVAWPVWDDTVDSLWSPVTGSVMIVTSLILVTTTILTLRNAGEEGLGLLN
jgi:uncharacterized protein (TIGR02611 family)